MLVLFKMGLKKNKRSKPIIDEELKQVVIEADYLAS